MANIKLYKRHTWAFLATRSHRFQDIHISNFVTMKSRPSHDGCGATWWQSRPSHDDSGATRWQSRPSHDGSGATRWLIPVFLSCDNSNLCIFHFQSILVKIDNWKVLPWKCRSRSFDYSILSYATRWWLSTWIKVIQNIFSRFLQFARYYYLNLLTLKILVKVTW